MDAYNQRTPSDRPRFSVAEERAHYLSHALGIALSVPAVALLIRLAAPRSAGTFIGCSVYGVTLVLMYLASTAYHAVPFRSRRTKQVLRMLDHSAIFLLICGTYTPLALAVLRDTTGYLLLGAVWALCGVGLVLTARRKPQRGGPILLYLAMGWAVAPALPALSRALGNQALLLFFLGGAFYTLGVPFYVWRRLRYHHAVWHGFVLLGSAFHFLAMMIFVVPYSGG